MIKYPIGIQSCQELRNDGYLYVDKTAFVHRLVSEGKYYFLSRPRRFGKSLLLSTIEAYFRGQRDLFRGLAIDRLATDWTEYPVLHLDFNRSDYGEPGALAAVVDDRFAEWETQYGLTPDSGVLPEIRFNRIIRAAARATGRQVVVLVDEYDKPVLQAAGDEAEASRMLSMLKGIYSNLKGMDRYIRFAMLSGVARFSKISIFSDLNNLRDISLANEFSEICGITRDELETSFQEGVRLLAEAEELTEADTLAQLESRYGGYRFARRCRSLFNPFSLMNVMAGREFGSYWFETGTPTFLVKMIRDGRWSLEALQRIETDPASLSLLRLYEPDPVAVLFQTGYLTIRSYDRDLELYRLDYPNREVKEGFLKFLLPYYFGRPESRMEFSIAEFIGDVRAGRPEEFMTRLATLVAQVPYDGSDRPLERHFQNIIYLVFTLMGFHTEMEMRTATGRIDLLVETSSFVYVFEFKIDREPGIAADQIDDRDYSAPFRLRGKRVYAIGASFDTSTRTLSAWTIGQR